MVKNQVLMCFFLNYAIAFLFKLRISWVVATVLSINWPCTVGVVWEGRLWKHVLEQR